MKSQKNGKRQAAKRERFEIQWKQVQRAIQESDNIFHALFDHSSDCVYINDLDGNFIYANPTALSLFG